MTSHEQGSGHEQLGLIRQGVEEIKKLVGVQLIQPSERRADGDLPVGLQLSSEEEAIIRRIASEKLGIGGAKDITLDKAGLDPEGLVIIEGGQSHKMLAELVVALDPGHTGPIIVSATEYRPIKQTEDDPRVRERANTAELLGITESKVGETELAVALQVIGSLPGYLPPSGDEDPIEGLTVVGSVNDRQIYIYSIPREYYQDESGSQKYLQPSASEQARFMMKATGVSEAALVTSQTYFSSRVVKGKGAYRVAAYCPATLARVRGLEPADTLPTMAQLLGEVAKTYQELSV